MNMTTEEHEAAVRGEGRPLAKLTVPQSWRKPAAASALAAKPQQEEEEAHTTGN